MKGREENLEQSRPQCQPCRSLDSGEHRGLGPRGSHGLVLGQCWDGVARPQGATPGRPHKPRPGQRDPWPREGVGDVGNCSPPGSRCGPVDSGEHSCCAMHHGALGGEGRPSFGRGRLLGSRPTSRPAFRAQEGSGGQVQAGHEQPQTVNRADTPCERGAVPTKPRAQT